MPRISSFYGIDILMFYDDHNPPHFHARYGEHTTRISIASLESLDFGFPQRALRLVLRWAEAHREELRENWERAREGLPLGTIDPLE